MDLAALSAVVLAVVRRDRVWLVLTSTVLLWVAIWIGFALHGWEPDIRYMYAPAAVMVVLAAAGIGRALACPPRAVPLRLISLVAVLVFLVALVPYVQTRLRLAELGVHRGRWTARQIQRLQSLIAQDGGGDRILACGQAVTIVSFQSILAWEIGENACDVGWTPGKLIRSGMPIVLFMPHGAGWKVRPIHIQNSKRASCGRLRPDTAFS